MSIGGILEGEELVIEESYYTKKEKIGASTLVDKEEIKTLAMRGQIEDLMNAIKMLPGVSYSSGFRTQLSIRGGHPDEVAASLDGFVVRWPYYWGGSASIFNPNIVEAAIFSNGAFSAKYGMAISGLLEVETKKPVKEFKVDSNIGFTTVEAFIQTPVGLCSWSAYRFRAHQTGNSSARKGYSRAH